MDPGVGYSFSNRIIYDLYSEEIIAGNRTPYITTQSFFFYQETVNAGIA